MPSAAYTPRHPAAGTSRYRSLATPSKPQSSWAWPRVFHGSIVPTPVTSSPCSHRAGQSLPRCARPPATSAATLMDNGYGQPHPGPGTRNSRPDRGHWTDRGSRASASSSRRPPPPGGQARPHPTLVPAPTTLSTSALMPPTPVREYVSHTKCSRSRPTVPRASRSLLLGRRSSERRQPLSRTGTANVLMFR